jgi:hypothetical protein
MHGLQPSPGPVAAPSALTLQLGHTHGSPLPMSLDERHDIGRSSPHDVHAERNTEEAPP